MVYIPSGQCRSGSIKGDLTASMIRYSAVRPEERMKFLTDAQSAVNVSLKHPASQAFGINKISSQPLAVKAKLLPNAKVMYRNGEVDPRFTGTWRSEGKITYQAPPGSSQASPLLYGIILTGRNIQDRNRGWQQNVEAFIKAVEDTKLGLPCFGCHVRNGGPPMLIEDPRALKEKIGIMKSHGAKIVFCLLVEDWYGDVKLAADSLGCTTQCVKWKNVQRPPSGYHFNLAIKVNAKLGGCNHTLTSRMAAQQQQAVRGQVFQDPPACLSWVFDRPCMLVGMDVSHAEIGGDSDSVAAIVGSLDGKASQYAAHISLQSARVEMISAIERGMDALLKSFKAKNQGKMPETIVIFRDGVADGQFEQVLQKELPMVKQAILGLGYTEDKVKIAVVICQKGHHTRLVFEETGGRFTSLNVYMYTNFSRFLTKLPSLILNVYRGGLREPVSRLSYRRFGGRHWHHQCRLQRVLPELPHGHSGNSQALQIRSHL